jgi:hypothetical protein
MATSRPGREAAAAPPEVRRTARKFRRGPRLAAPTNPSGASGGQAHGPGKSGAARGSPHRTDPRGAPGKSGAPPGSRVRPAARRTGPTRAAPPESQAHRQEVGCGPRVTGYRPTLRKPAGTAGPVSRPGPAGPALPGLCPAATRPGHRRGQCSGRRDALVECTKQFGPGLYAERRSPQTAQCRSTVDTFRTGRRVALPGRDPATTSPPSGLPLPARGPDQITTP